MDQSKFQFNRRPQPQPAPPQKDKICISCRALNPLSLQDDLSKVFLDETQARATTATRLFRNDELFESLRKYALQNYFANPSMSRRKFSLWSTGCSSGEEVYSLAMVALNEFSRNRRPPLFEAFGTDINRERIQEAKAGTYIKPTREAFSQNYWQILGKYAEIDGADVHMGNELRTLCKFGIFDMRQKAKTHTFHFIVCNHVLQYYDSPGQIHILKNLIAVLNPGGSLYLEGAMADAVKGAGLQEVGGFANVFIPGHAGNVRHA